MCVCVSILFFPRRLCHLILNNCRADPYFGGPQAFVTALFRTVHSLPPRFQNRVCRQKEIEALSRKENERRRIDSEKERKQKKSGVCVDIDRLACTPHQATVVTS